MGSAAHAAGISDLIKNYQKNKEEKQAMGNRL
jgi:hypothetical protein